MPKNISFKQCSYFCSEEIRGLVNRGQKVLPRTIEKKGFDIPAQYLPQDGYVDTGARTKYVYPVDLNDDGKSEFSIEAQFETDDLTCRPRTVGVVRVLSSNEDKVCIEPKCLDANFFSQIRTSVGENGSPKGILEFERGGDNWVPFELIVGDFNGDGLKDFAISNVKFYDPYVNDQFNSQMIYLQQR